MHRFSLDPSVSATDVGRSSPCSCVAALSVAACAAITDHMSVPIVHHPAYCASLPANHRFPMDKFRAVAALIEAEGLLGEGRFYKPRAAPFDWVALAHDPVYVDQVFSTNVPKAVAREIGFDIQPDIAARARYATGGTVLTGYLALEHGIACNTAGGSHHARWRQGAGFCVFNDVAVAIRVMQADGVISRALVIDLDVHQGDGTADIFRHCDSVFTFSMHARKNYPVRKVPSNHDIELPDGASDNSYLAHLAARTTEVLTRARPDIVFYNAGVDPYKEDRLGRLALSRAGLLHRDTLVIQTVRQAGIPLAGVLGGGYSEDIDELADRHVTLHRAALACAKNQPVVERTTGHVQTG